MDQGDKELDIFSTSEESKTPNFTDKQNKEKEEVQQCLKDDIVNENDNSFEEILEDENGDYIQVEA